MNGERVGITPVTYTETTVWEKVYIIEMNKPGFKAVKRDMRQTEWNMGVAISVGATSLCLGTPVFVIGALPLIGLLWSRQLPDHVIITLDKGTSAPDTSAAAPSQYGY